MDLIDTLWNVKRCLLQMVMVLLLDLIDTLWNVKPIIKSLSERIITDLIDTLWNLKTQFLNDWFSGNLRFNRYIVECKVLLLVYITSNISGFNRYIVECKVRMNLLEGRISQDLIDTLWNVKARKTASGSGGASI